MLPVQPHPAPLGPDGLNDSKVTLSASPGWAPSMNTGPVTGLTRPRSSLARSAAVELLESCPDEASSVSNSTVSPGLMVMRGLKELSQPWWMQSRWIVCLPCPLMSPSPLDSDRERAVDHQVRPGDPAGHRARDEDDAVRHLLGGAELARRVDLERRGEEVGHVLLDVLPDTAVEVGVAGRHAVDADGLADELAAQALGVVDQRRLDGAVGTGGKIDLEAGDAGDQH